MKSEVFSGALLALLSVALVGATAEAAQPSRVWTFELKDAGTYKVQISHAKGNEPAGTKVNYAITVGDETQKRDLDLFAEHPFVPVVIPLPRPGTMRVVISGISEDALRKTQVYVYAADSQFPGEYYDPRKGTESKEAQRIRSILAQPEPSIDLAKVKIAVDRMVDPRTDAAATQQKVDAIVERIRAMPEFGPTSDAKLAALRRYIYESGAWNDGQPFQYDLDDPLGTTLSNKLLATYLSTKKGNCVTMPFLFVILGQRLGLDVTVSTAPKHFLVKYKSDQYGWINLEATSGANPARDVWIRTQEPMTDEALANGVYLQPLTRKESAAEMATIVAESYLTQQKYEQAIAITDVILDYYPKDVGTMTMKAVAYGRLARQRFESLYPSPAQIPQEQQGYYQYLSERNRMWFAKAESLGWREERPEDHTDYLKRVEQAKQRQATAPAANN